MNVKRPNIGLGIIILKEQKVLLGKRKGSHGEGQWAFPGGHLEWFEEFEECFYRELEEETGLTRENVILIDKSPVKVTNDFFHEKNKHYVTLYMRGRYLSGNVENKEPKKCYEWQWFDWKNPPTPLFNGVRELYEEGYNPFFTE